MKKSLILLLVVFLFTAVSALADNGMKIVNFSDAGLEKETEGITFADGTLTIVAPGEYMLSGELTNGQLLVDCEDEGKVTLYLNGVTIHTEGAVAIRFGECKPKAVLSLVDGSENVFSNAAQDDLDEDEEPNGVIFSQTDLVIEGSGSLKVTSAFADGIKSTNKKDPERGYVAVRGGVISIRCGDEPIQFVTDCTIENAKISIAMSGEK